MPPDMATGGLGGAGGSPTDALSSGGGRNVSGFGGFGGGANIVGKVVDNAALALDRSGTFTLAGTIFGTGTLS